MSLPTFEKKRLMGIIAVLSFGLTSLFAVSPLEFLVPATFIAGFFLLLPLVWLLGDDFPLVKPAGADDSAAMTAENPVAALRERYASGEIDDAEFERRLDRLLQTEDLEAEFDDRPTESGSGIRSSDRREREREPGFEGG